MATLTSPPSRPDSSPLEVPSRKTFKALRWWWPSRRTRIGVEGVLLTLAIIAAVIWFGTPYFLRDYINRRFAGLPGYSGRVEWVQFNPITASFDIDNFHIDKKGVPVPFYRSPHWKVALQWSEILHGTTRATIIMDQPVVNLVSGPDSDQSQLSISMIWVDTIKQLIPWRVNQVFIHQGEVHFRDFHADPPVDLVASDVELAAQNISNSAKLKVPLPATIKISCRPLRTGTFEMNLAVNFEEEFATFTQDFRMEHVPAVGANSALKKYLKVEMKSGEIALYSQLTGDKGVYHGYVKPFFYKLEFMPKPEDRNGLGAIWSGILNTVKGIFEDNRDVIATQANISGKIDQPAVDGWGAFIGILWNAYIESLRTGFDPQHAPPKPTDTVTTPQSAETQKEAQQLPARQKAHLKNPK